MPLPVALTRGVRSVGVVALWVACLSGCGARVVRFAEKGVSCVEAQSLAINAVRKMGYGIDESLKPLPGTPGVIRASRLVGTQKQGLFVQVFCTTLGAEVQAQTAEAGIAQLTFGNEFRRAFEAATAERPGQRAPAADGLDVTVTPERGSGSEALPVDLSAAGLFPVSVRIINNTSRVYQLKLKWLVLSTTAGEKVMPLALDKVIGGLDASTADIVRNRVLAPGDIPAGGVASGVVFYPMNPYARARVSLKDLATGEPEGFSIDF